MKIKQINMSAVRKISAFKLDAKPSPITSRMIDSLSLNDLKKLVAYSILSIEGYKAKKYIDAGINADTKITEVGFAPSLVNTLIKFFYKKKFEATIRLTPKTLPSRDKIRKAARLRHLTKFTYSELIGSKGMGKTTMKDVLAALDASGLELKKEKQVVVNEN